MEFEEPVIWPILYRYLLNHIAQLSSHNSRAQPTGPENVKAPSFGVTPGTRIRILNCKLKRLTIVDLIEKGTLE